MNGWELPVAFCAAIGVPALLYCLAMLVRDVRRAMRRNRRIVKRHERFGASPQDSASAWWRMVKR